MNQSMILSNMTGPFLEYCQYQKRLSPATIKAYRFDLQDFFHFLTISGRENLPVDRADRRLLEQYVNYMGAEQFSVKTVKRRIACLRSFFDYLEYQELIPQTPFVRFRMDLKEPPKPPRTMPLSEVQQLLRTVYEAMPPELPHHFKDIVNGHRKIKPGSQEFLWLRDVAILEVLFASGLRVGELCSLKFEDLDTVQQSLRVHGKGGKVRTVYLCNGDVLRTFGLYIAARKHCDVDSPYIFISKFKRQLSTQGVRNMILRYTGDAGIVHRITPHMFRHTFATLLLEEGVDIKYIQDFLGHSSISTTQIYLHTSPGKQKSILQTCHPRELFAVSASISEDNVKLSVKKGNPMTRQNCKC